MCTSSQGERRLLKKGRVSFKDTKPTSTQLVEWQKLSLHSREQNENKHSAPHGTRKRENTGALEAATVPTYITDALFTT